MVEISVFQIVKCNIIVNISKEGNARVETRPCNSNCLNFDEFLVVLPTKYFNLLGKHFVGAIKALSSGLAPSLLEDTKISKSSEAKKSFNQTSEEAQH